MLNVAVLVGGRSVEHEVAVITAMQMIENMDKSKYNIYPIYINNKGKWLVGEGLGDFETYKNGSFENTKEVYINPSFGDKTFYTIEEKEVSGGLFGKPSTSKELVPYAKIDVALLGLHGTNSEDGAIQGLLETMGIAYTGGNIVSSAVGMDKVLMKDVYKKYNIPLVEYQWFYRDTWEKDQDSVIKEMEKIGYPLIVKPSNLGSSIGISMAEDREGLINAINIAKEYDKKIIVERAVENLREVNCAVLGYEDDLITSATEEPIGWEEFQTFENKYNKDGGTQRDIPANIDDELTEQIKHYAKEAFRVINCSGTARIDFLIENDRDIYVNEINTLPGSSAQHLWEAEGIPYEELIDKLIEIALKKQKDKDNNMVVFESDIYEKTAYGTKAGQAKGVSAK